MADFSFQDFVAKFPVIDMPVTLGEDTHFIFSAQNEPLAQGMVEQFIAPLEGSTGDEFTEFVPCFALDNTPGFVALIWWRAGLLEYEYTLATFLEKGGLIDKKVIAFTRVKADRIFRSVATIDADHTIFMALGDTAAKGNDLNPQASRMETLEVMGDGQIV